MKLDASTRLANFRDFDSIAFVGLKMVRFTASLDFFDVDDRLKGLRLCDRRQCATPIRRRLAPLEILRGLARVERHAIGAAGWDWLADTGFGRLDLGELRVSRGSSPESTPPLDLDQGDQAVPADFRKKRLQLKIGKAVCLYVN